MVERPERRRDMAFTPPSDITFTRESEIHDDSPDGSLSTKRAAELGPGSAGSAPAWMPGLFAGGASSAICTAIDKANGDALLYVAITAWVAYLIYRVIIEWPQRRQ